VSGGDRFPTIENYAAADGERLAVRVWRPAAVPRARVVFLHGIVSHGGWYGASCAHLAAAGCEAHFLERRGSGLSGGPAGDVDHWQTWPADVEAYLERLGDERPRVLAGISWGGKLAAAVARRRPERVDALALICPGIYAHQQPGPLQRWALQLARLPVVGRRKVKIPLDDPALFTDVAVHRAYVGNDPLALRRITLRFALADQRLTHFARGAAGSLRMPTLLVLAGRDPIVDSQRMLEYLDATAADDKTVFEYPTAAHTLEFDPDAVRYCDDLTQWVLRVVS
jgi:alpha-beta hydrolase superfamily lysophospholipase